MMSVMRKERASSSLLVAVILGTCALCNASLSSDLLRGDNRESETAILLAQLVSSDVADCAINSCSWPSTEKAKRLCIYLLCLRHSNDMGSPTATGEDEMFTKRSALKNILPQFPEEESRHKRWQYPDPLQHCIQKSCQGQRGREFYACVYTNCIIQLSERSVA